MKTEPVADLELIALEEAFADDCECDVYHHGINPICSEVVTHHLSTACGIESNWCENTVRTWASISKKQVCICLKVSVSDCWTIRPI